MPRSSFLVAIVVLVLAAGCGTPGEPSPTVTASPLPPSPIAPSSPVAPTAPTVEPTTEPTPEPTVAGSGLCAPADLAVEQGPWDAGAGSRFTQVTVANQGDGDCMLPFRPVVAIVDAGRSQLVVSDPAGEGAGPILASGDGATFALQFGNWCDPSVVLPARALLLLEGSGVGINGPALENEDDLPPCNGPDQPPVLSTTDWEAT